MRKVLFILLALVVLVLTGCDSSEVQTGEVDSENQNFSITDEALKERDAFIESYNEIINNSDDIGNLIETTKIKEPELNEEQNHYTQTLLNVDDKGIIVSYSAEGELTGYLTSEISESASDLPINVSFVTVSALDLDINEYAEAFSETMVTDESLKSESYQDNEYEIFLTYSEVDDKTMFTMTINKAN